MCREASTPEPAATEPQLESPCGTAWDPMWCHWDLTQISIYIYIFYDSPGGSDSKASAYNAGDPGSVPGSGDLLEKEMATHSSTLAWKMPWTEEPGWLQSMGSQRVRQDWATSLSFIYFLCIKIHVYLKCAASWRPLPSSAAWQPEMPAPTYRAASSLGFLVDQW